MRDERDGRRQAKRYARGIYVELHTSAGGTMVRARDVSRHGLFLAMDNPPPEGHVVLLTVHLPGAPFETMATIARRVDDDVADHGAGVKLYCLAADGKARWDRFINALAREDAARQPAPASKPGDERAEDAELGSGMVSRPRRRFTEYAFVSAKVAPAESAQVGSAIDDAVIAISSVPAEELATVEGELLELEPLSDDDKAALFDFNWRNDE